MPAMIHLSQLVDGLVAFCGKEDPVITGIQSDSRHVKQGDVFIAYPGLRVDGRQFIAKAIEQGAVAVIYESEQCCLDGNFSVPLVPVENLRRQVGYLASRYYQNPSENMTIVGVTGTNGKTSCAQFVASVLQRQRIACGVMGTLGYGFLPNLHPTAHTTLDPIHLQSAFAKMRAEGAAAVVLEVSSHALDQERVSGVHFDIGVFTQLSRDHLDYHGDMESYANAKIKLFQQPGLRYGVVNADDPLGQKIIRDYRDKIKIIAYSVSNTVIDHASTIVAKKITPLSRGFRVDVQTPWGAGDFTTNLLGRFNISNLLAVLGILCLFDLPLSTVLVELSQLNNVKGRMQCFGGEDKPLVVVDYAHTPDALEKALIALREHCRGKLWGVIGCGGDRDRGKRPQMATIVERYADRVVLTNDNPRSEPPLNIIRDMQAGLKSVQSAKIELDRELAIQFAVQSASIGDIVLIAGKGHETTQIIGDKVIPFDDGDIVRKSLEKK